MKSVAITGAGGFVGSAIGESLRADGVEVYRLVRRPARADDEISWSPTEGTIEAAKLEGIDAVVHLAGENIAGLWTAAKKERIRESRVAGTRLLAETLARLADPPAVLVSTSGVNYYGDSGERVLTEAEPPGDDFLAEVCIAWEAATGPASDAGIRVVINRMALVLGSSGGALPLMLPIFKLGVGGKLGTGQQWMAWIALADAVRVFRYALSTSDLSGPVNVASPEPVRNSEFTAALARTVHRPALLGVPSFALRAATGGMADALLLSSLRVQPAALRERGFEFALPSVGAALAAAVDGNG